MDPKVCITVWPSHYPLRQTAHIRLQGRLVTNMTSIYVSLNGRPRVCVDKSILISTRWVERGWNPQNAFMIIAIWATTQLKNKPFFFHLVLLTRKCNQSMMITDWWCVMQQKTCTLIIALISNKVSSIMKFITGVYYWFLSNLLQSTCESILKSSGKALEDRRKGSKLTSCTLLW